MFKFKKSLNLFLGISLLVYLLASCETQPSENRAIGHENHDENTDDWPTGLTDERINAVARHMGGFSRAMMEIGYRYNELYFAGQDENWEFADYHLEHIIEALEDAVERRPAREGSANEFLQSVVPAMQNAIDQQDLQIFNEQFDVLMNYCNVCHIKEDHGFIKVRMPERRLFPVY